MRNLFYLFGLLLLTSCSFLRPEPPTALHASPVALNRAPGDSLPALVYPAEDRPGLDRASSLSFFGRIWRGRHRQPATEAETVAVAPGTSVVLPGKMKHSQVTVVIGNGNSTRAAHTDKNKAPAQMATDSSTQNAVLGGGQLTPVNGDGNRLKLANAPVAAPGPLAVVAAKLTGPLGWVLGGGVAGCAVYFLIWPVVRRRAKKAVADAIV